MRGGPQAQPSGEDEEARMLLPEKAPTQQQKRSSSVLLTVCPYILGNELCERLAYYGLATNLVTYITQVMGGDPAFAAILVAMFEGVCYTTPLIGALLADSLWGRYKTIFVFSCIYMLGILLLTLSSMIPDSDEDADKANPLQFGVLFASLAIISLGTGGIKPNVSAFGADQFDEGNPQDCREKQSFFNWFYLAINVGSLIAGTVIVYIQDSVSWTIGFAVPGCAMGLAILLFWLGSPGYKHVLPTESPMARVVKVVWAAWRNRWRKAHPQFDHPAAGTNSNHVVVGRGSDGSWTPSYHGGTAYQQLVLGKASAPSRDPSVHGPFSMHADGSGLDSEDSGGGPGLQRSNSMLSMPGTSTLSYRWLEDAVTDWETSQGDHMHVGGGLAGYTARQVEEVKLVLRLLPIFGATILYWTIYTQMGTLFVQQGNLMTRTLDLPWTGNSFQVPSASMSIFNTLSIILLIWLYDAYFEPALLRTKRFQMTKLRRQGWGMLIAAFAMVYAGGIEVWRLRTLAAARGGDDAYNRPNAAAPLSIFWQAPAYFLIGLSEVFTSIGQLEFFYDQAPDVMRSCSMAMCLLSTALGSYFAGVLTLLVQACSQRVTGMPWLPNDLNMGRIDLFFFLLAALMACNLMVFIIVAMRYKYKQVAHKKRPRLAIADGTIFEDTTAEAGGPALLSRSITAPGGLVPHPADGVLSQQLQRQMRQQQRQQQQALQAATAPLAMGRGRPQAHRGGGREAEDIYARSLAYVPPSPNLPPNMR